MANLLTRNGRLSRRLEHSQLKARLAHEQVRAALAEQTLAITQSWVDPQDAFLDELGNRWQQLGSGFGAGADERDIVAARNEDELKMMRVRSRMLVEGNEYAKNASDNLVDYVIGTGMGYKVQARPGFDVNQDDIDARQEAVDEFLERQGWAEDEQEIVSRTHRDGEAFVRKFVDGNRLTVRMIEPSEVSTPTEKLGRTPDEVARDSFGIRVAERDVRQPLGYFIRGETPIVPADQIEHLKINVDKNVKRGKPTFWPIRIRLEHAMDALMAMSYLLRIQSAYAAVRTHEGVTKAQVTSFRDEKTDVEVQDQRAGRSRFFRRFTMPREVNVPVGQKLEFPAHKVNAKDWVDVIQALLRPAAARLRMPEWMFTMRLDAKFHNALMAEAPFTKMVSRWQRYYGRRFARIVMAAVDARAGEGAGQLPQVIAFSRTLATGEVAEADRPTWDVLRLQVEPQTLDVRDELKDAQASQLLSQAGLLSLRTWSQRLGLDFDHERANIEEEELEIGSTAKVGTDDDRDGDGDDDDEGGGEDESGGGDDET